MNNENVLFRIKDELFTVAYNNDYKEYDLIYVPAVDIKKKEIFSLETTKKDLFLMLNIAVEDFYTRNKKEVFYKCLNNNKVMYIPASWLTEI